MDDLAGFVIDIDDLEVQKKSIGKGSYSSVYKAIRKLDGKEFALKVFDEDTFKDETQKKMFIREVTLLAKLMHPCVLGLEGFFCPEDDSGKNPLIMTEFMPNGDLFAMLKKISHNNKNNVEGDVNFDTTCLMITAFGIAVGMRHVHRLGCIHRDLKPANIMLNGDLEPKIADFGLAKCSDGMQSMIGGSPYWMAPELHMGQPYDASVDVYAYGVILYQILTKTIPFDGVFNAVQIREVICRGDRPKIPDTVDPFYADIVRKCWDQNPSRRPSFEHIVNRFMSASSFLPNTNFIKYDNYRKRVLSHNPPIERPLEIHSNESNDNADGKNRGSVDLLDIFDAVSWKTEGNSANTNRVHNDNNEGPKSDNLLDFAFSQLQNTTPINNTSPVRTDNLFKFNTDPFGLTNNASGPRPSSPTSKSPNAVSNSKNYQKTPRLPQKFGFNYVSKIPRLTDNVIQSIKEYLNMSMDEIFRQGMRMISEKDKSRKVKGIMLLRYAGEKGHSDALFECGVCLMRGNGCRVNPLKALMYFVSSASKGNPKANFECAKLLMNGTVIPRDNQKAVHFLKQAADQGVVEAMLRLGQLIIYNNCGITDFSIANHYFREGAHLGNVDCMFLYAYNLENGLGFSEPNQAEAIKYYEMAADLQHPDSLCNLGRIYENINKDKAAELYRRAALTGSSLGMFNYASLLETFYGDKEKSHHFFKMAADRGDSDACIHVYKSSNDPSTRMHYLEKAARLGNVRGEYAYGVELYKGKNVKRNVEEALRLLKLAANKGYQRSADFLKKIEHK